MSMKRSLSLIPRRYVTAALTTLPVSDRTDLSTESGSGPIQ